MLLPLLPSLCVEGTLLPRIRFGFKIPIGVDGLHGDCNHDGVGDVEIPTDGLALCVLHQVDVLMDALGVSIKGAHLDRHLDEIGVVQSPSTFADMNDYLAVRDGDVDCAGVTEILVPSLLDNVVQEFGDAPLGGKVPAPILLLGDPFSGFWETFGLRRVFGDGQVVVFYVRRRHELRTVDGGVIGIGGDDSPHVVGHLPVLVLVVWDVEEEGCEDLVGGNDVIVGRLLDNGSELQLGVGEGIYSGVIATA